MNHRQIQAFRCGVGHVTVLPVTADEPTSRSCEHCGRTAVPSADQPYETISRAPELA